MTPAKEEKFKEPFLKRLERSFTLLGLSKEKEMFVENVSMLIASGMDMLNVLKVVRGESRNASMRKLVDEMTEQIEGGSSISKTFERSGLFSEQTLALMRVGEEGGRLSENLSVIARAAQKDREFRSRIRAAMLYPMFVLVLAGVIGIGIAWFILPNLAQVFSELDMELPLVTKVLIAMGFFLGENGAIAVPSFIAVVAIILYFVFIFSSTKFIGQFILFSLPGINRLITEVELARMGYVMSSLLSAGLPIVDALDALSRSTTMRMYSRYYVKLRDHIEDGDTFEDAFRALKKSRKFIPPSLQQMVVAAEHSARLPEAFQKISDIYEVKTENTTKSLAVILEPLLLVLVWVGVLGVALAVILPIYSLIGGLTGAMDSPQPTGQNTEVIVEEPLEEAPLEMPLIEIPTEQPVEQGETVEEPEVVESTLPAPDGAVEVVETEPVIEEPPVTVEEPEGQEPVEGEVQGARTEADFVTVKGHGFVGAYSRPSQSAPIIQHVRGGQRYAWDILLDGWCHLVFGDGQGGWVRVSDISMGDGI